MSDDTSPLWHVHAIMWRRNIRGTEIALLSRRYVSGCIVVVDYRLSSETLVRWLRMNDLHFTVVAFLTGLYRLLCRISGSGPTRRDKLSPFSVSWHEMEICAVELCFRAWPVTCDHTVTCRDVRSRPAGFKFQKFYRHGFSFQHWWRHVLWQFIF